MPQTKKWFYLCGPQEFTYIPITWGVFENPDVHLIHTPRAIWVGMPGHRDQASIIVEISRWFQYALKIGIQNSTKITKYLDPSMALRLCKMGIRLCPLPIRNRLSKETSFEILRERHYVNINYYYCELAGVWDIYLILFNHPSEAKCPRDVESAHHYS